MMKKHVLLLASVLLTGCAGGGGSLHDRPASVAQEKDFHLELELSVWGAGSHEITKRFRNVVLAYSIDGNDPKEIEMRNISSTRRSGIWSATVPREELEAGSNITYEFKYELDGMPHSRPEQSVPIK